MTLAAEMLAREAVAKLVKNFGEPHGGGQPNPVAGAEELVEAGKPALKFVELGEHQRFTGPWLFAATLVMTAAAVLLGVFRP